MNAVKAIKGHIGFICPGTGPPPMISLTSSDTSDVQYRRFGGKIATNGVYLAVASATGLYGVEVFNIVTGALEYTLSDQVLDNIEMNDSLLVVGCGRASDINTDGAAQVYSLADGSLVSTITDFTGDSSTSNLKYVVGISPNNNVVVSNSDSGNGNGEWAVYSTTMSGNTIQQLQLTPNATSGSQRSFIVDAGLKIGDWSIVQGLNGHLLTSTSVEVLLAGELPGPILGGHLFTRTSYDSYTFTVPSGVTSISVLAVGAGGGGGIGSATSGTYGQSGGGGGGGALAYANDIEVSPGDVLYVEIGTGGQTGQPGTNGGDTILKRVNGTDNSGSNTYEELLVAGGGAGGTTHMTHAQNTGAGGQPSGTELDGGGNGGTGGGRSFRSSSGGGGGGAGGYTGNGGDGKHWGGNSTAGTGGAGGGGYALENSTGLGGGVGLYGEGSSGSAGTSSSVHGGSGSGLQEFSGNSSDYAIQYGAGGFGTARKGYVASQGGDGALRIIWGANRAFPSTDVGESSNTESLN